jgi:hypothetical protein
MADTNLNIKVRLQNLVTGELDKIKTGFKGLKNFSQDWVSLTAKVYLFTNAIRTASRFLGSFVSQAMRQEDAIHRLSNAVELNGEQTDRVTQKYVKFATQLQRTTRYGDEELMELMQQLVSVGGVAEAEMERATRVAIDFASATGRDLGTAGLTVAKAMAGATGELSRYGIILGDNIPASQKATRALEEMEKKFGGMAQRDVSTYAGTLAQMKNAFSDLQESLGGFITESSRWKGVMDDLKYSFEWWTNWLDTQKKQSSSPLYFLEKDLKKIDAEIIKQQKLAEKALWGQEPVLKRLEALNQQRLDIVSAINLEHQLEKQNVVDLEKIVVKSTKTAEDSTTDTFKMMESVAEQTAKNMHNAFSDFFFKGLKGELNNLRDIMTSFGDAMLQMFAQMMAFQSMKMMFGKVGFFADFFKSGFAVGTNYVPQTGLYPLHKGETVTPAGNARGGAGGGVTINVNQAITAWDASDVYRNRKALADAVAFEIQSNGNIRSAIQKYT